MDFLIADTFTDSLAKLSGEEWKAVKTTLKAEINEADNASLKEVYNTERHLLYVACRRARDHLRVSSVEPASEFLGDLLVDIDR